MQTVKLANGVEVPQLGFGTFKLDPADCARRVREAIEAGYRHVDTAQFYRNEAEVGQGVKDSGVARGEIFLTTKVWPSNYGYDKALASVEASLKKLQTDYVDLLLLHQPFGDTYGAWRALERLYQEGIVRAIGVSNFLPERVADLAAFNEVAPMVNQIETNPLMQQTAAHEAMESLGVVHEAWAPFGEGMQNMFENPVLVKVAQKHDKSVAQVILRWLVQRGVVVLSKSAHRERMEQNLDVFGFELDAEDLAAIAGLDRGESLFGANYRSIELPAKYAKAVL